MQKIKTHLRKWGNSLGVTLPKSITDAGKMKEGMEITITIEPKNKMSVKDIFEFAEKNPLPKPKKSIKEIIKEIDRDLWSE